MVRPRRNHYRQVPDPLPRFYLADALKDEELKAQNPQGFSRMHDLNANTNCIQKQLRDEHGIFVHAYDIAILEEGMTKQSLIDYVVRKMSKSSLSHSVQREHSQDRAGLSKSPLSHSVEREHSQDRAGLSKSPLTHSVERRLSQDRADLSKTLSLPLVERTHKRDVRSRKPPPPPSYPPGSSIGGQLETLSKVAVKSAIASAVENNNNIMSKRSHGTEDFGGEKREKKESSITEEAPPKLMDSFVPNYTSAIPVIAGSSANSEFYAQQVLQWYSTPAGFAQQQMIAATMTHMMPLALKAYSDAQALDEQKNDCKKSRNHK